MNAAINATSLVSTGMTSTGMATPGLNLVEWALQCTLLLLLLAALPFAFRLERGLALLRRERAALAGNADGFEAATRGAGSVLASLRATLEVQARQAAAADALRDDLRFLVDRAEGLADRLEAAVRQSRALPPIAAQHPAASYTSSSYAPPAYPSPPEPDRATPAETPRSQAERDLLHALRLAR